MTGCVNQICSKEIALQTLIVRARCGTKEKTVRIFLDNGSQRSYILKSTAKDLELEVKGTNKITHSLFGGTQTEVITHNIHHVTLDKIGGKEYSCIIGVRDEEKICNFIPRVSSNSIVVKELNRKKIKLSDVGDGCPPIEILLGVDVYGRLLTGNKITLSNEVTAIETKLGWTLCGRMGERDDNNLSMCILSMVIQDASVSQLWDLDLLGIRDETDVISVEQQEQEDKQKFFNCLTRNADGRYVVSLPWIDDHPPLPTNYEVARLRLNHATKRLEENKLFEEYAKLFQLWKDEDFIEEINPIVCDKKEKVHYVSHRAVIKLSSSTTPVRPVFDASCKVGKGPSLNECLKKGNNFIKMIPDMLLLFREKKVGFVSDIRKAIQMIEVNEQDRDCMRFLWWKDKSKQHVVEYRHKRVMFGTNCSPFILGAVLEFHLVNVQNENKDIAQKLYNSLYVDNCVSSENTVEEYKNFRTKSVQLLAEAGMDLRLWMSNVDEMEDKNSHVISVLGMQWDRVCDELYVDVKLPTLPEIITKKVMLSIAHQVFDPIGIVCPAVLPVKVLLQKTFINKLNWKEPVPTEEKNKFTEWYEQLHLLSQVRIPRCVTGGEFDRSKWPFHVFTDASGLAYGAVIFLRVEHVGGVSIQLISAKSRVAPIKRITIPRLLNWYKIGCFCEKRIKS
ncbi:uncharacterized protein LOC116180688 [Photinus pyralis]|uniref:uncharacterized protein LOC116180688 n=1 Tax=Photinus pyralis TaxID=7054 RepID=UPI00126740B2|nr:uncharacterized protein LOC116180688 [Photinus pyralis]